MDNLADTALHRKGASHLPAGNPVVASTEASREGSVLPHRVDTVQLHNRITRHRVTLATLTVGSSHPHPERTDKKSTHKKNPGAHGTCPGVLSTEPLVSELHNGFTEVLAFQHAHKSIDRVLKTVRDVLQVLHLAGRHPLGHVL